jgi:hypothetical protein
MQAADIHTAARAFPLDDERIAKICIATFMLQCNKSLTGVGAETGSRQRRGEHYD